MSSSPSSTRVKNTSWELIAESLRQELAGYGGLLRLFQVQQRALLERDTDAVLHQGASIETLARTLADCRRRRENLIAAFARQHGRSDESTLRSLLALIDSDARPLLEALIDEVNHLLHRVRHASRRNQALLSRAVKSHRETIQLLTSKKRVKKSAGDTRTEETIRQAGAALLAG